MYVFVCVNDPISWTVLGSPHQHAYAYIGQAYRNWVTVLNLKKQQRLDYMLDDIEFRKSLRREWKRKENRSEYNTL